MNLVSLVKLVANLKKIRPLLRINIRKWKVRRTIWLLVNGSLWITFSRLYLASCIIKRDTLMLRIYIMVVANLWIMHPGTSRFGIKLHSVPMITLRLSFSTNAMRPTTKFAFRRTILIMLCSPLRILWIHQLKSTNTSDLVDLVLLIRMASPSVESKWLLEWPAPWWFTLTCAVPRVLSMLNCGPCSLTTKCSRTIKCLTMILVCPNVNSGSALTFSPDSWFC